jgi:predicted O-linked N-acetylglucosamine transferase (SPINDLY family)
MTDPDSAFTAAADRHRQGDLAAAETLYRALLQTWPHHAPTLSNLGVLCARAGRLDEAADCYRAALTADPRNADAHFNLANLHRRTGRLPDAATHYQDCLAINPDHTGALFNLGLVRIALDDPAGAVACFRRVTDLEPGSVDGFGRLGDALVRLGRFDDGLSAFRRAVELNPLEPRGHYNLGLALANAGRTDESLPHLQSALSLRPDYAEAHNALGLNLESQGKVDDALAHYREAVRLRPDLADAWSNLGTCLGEQGRADEAIECLRESLRLKPASTAVHSNLILLLNYSSRTRPGAVRAESERWASRFGPVPAAPPVPGPHDPDRRLRLGYLSADFRTHTVAPFIETLLCHHDRRQVEVVAYASVLRPDETTSRLRGLADLWRPVGGLPDRDVATLVRDDRIDVLVDLAGHTAGNRLGVLAARPAPVQATLFGYPQTTGLAAVDYRITDAVSDPPGQSEHNSVERLLYLPVVPWVYSPPPDAPPVAPLPGRDVSSFTLGCLNNPAKLSEACLTAWANLLHAVPEARIVLLAGRSQVGRERLREHFERSRIAENRVDLLGRLPRPEYFATYCRFDLSLDPFPYNGGVTTGDSLWMGVPVVGRAGDDYRSRQGLMAMRAVGLCEFVTDAPEGLVQVVREWSQRRSELAVIRRGLRERLAASPLADAPRYVRNLEEAVRRVWRDRLPG